LALGGRNEYRCRDASLVLSNADLDKRHAYAEAKSSRSREPLITGENMPARRLREWHGMECRHENEWFRIKINAESAAGTG